MDGIIKVDPQQLISAASEFGGIGSQIQTLTSDMVSTIDSLKSAWEGEAANTYNLKFHQLQDDMDKMHQMIQEHVKDLGDMAQAYMEAENANIDTGNSLAGDVIS